VAVDYDGVPTSDERPIQRRHHLREEQPEPESISPDERPRNLRRQSPITSPTNDEATRGVLDFARRVQEHERLHNVLLTVGDGLLLAWPAPQ
jgi:hypothetical protein